MKCNKTATARKVRHQECDGLHWNWRKRSVCAAIAIAMSATLLSTSLSDVFAEPTPAPGSSKPSSESSTSPASNPDDAAPDGESGRGWRKGEFREQFRRARQEMREQRGDGTEVEGRAPGRDGGGRRFGGGRFGGHGGGPGKFMEVIRNYQAAVQDPYQAIGMAVLGINAQARRDGKPLNAITELEMILDSSKDQRIRNIALFGMRQVYEEARQSEKFIEVSKRIIQENIVAAEKKPAPQVEEK